LVSAKRVAIKIARIFGSNPPSGPRAIPYNGRPALANHRESGGIPSTIRLSGGGTAVSRRINREGGEWNNSQRSQQDILIS